MNTTSPNDENTKSKTKPNNGHGHDHSSIDFKLTNHHTTSSHIIDNINVRDFCLFDFLFPRAGLYNSFRFEKGFNKNAIDISAAINQQLSNSSSRLNQLISSSNFNSRRKTANLMKIINERQQKQQNTSCNSSTPTNTDNTNNTNNNNVDDNKNTNQKHLGPMSTNQHSFNHTQLFANMSLPLQFNQTQAKPELAHHLNHKPKKRYNVWDEQLYADVIPINCNSIIAELHKEKFGSGGKGKCIRFDNKWMTPIEFEQYCGKGNCRDWKRTLKAGGQPLINLLEDNILMCHAVSCACAACSDDASVIGPIRPFTRYRRRKREEIVAQNALKKLVSLKPPTLIGDQLIARIDNRTSCCNSNNSSAFVKTDETYSNNGYRSPTNSQNEYTDSFEFDEPFMSSYKKLEVTEQKHWTLLEEVFLVFLFSEIFSSQSEIDFLSIKGREHTYNPGSKSQRTY
jgi:hypothetical protein